MKISAQMKVLRWEYMPRYKCSIQKNAQMKAIKNALLIGQISFTEEQIWQCYDETGKFTNNFYKKLDTLF